MFLATPRRWSILLWVVAVALGFLLTARKVPAWRVVVLVVAPSGEAGADTAHELADALDTEAGEQGVTPELRVFTRSRDKTTEREEIERLGFPPSDDVLVGVVECDDADRPIRLVDRIAVRSDTPKTAEEAVRAARDWAAR